MALLHNGIGIRTSHALLIGICPCGAGNIYESRFKTEDEVHQDLIRAIAHHRYPNTRRVGQGQAHCETCKRTHPADMWHWTFAPDHTGDTE